MDDQAFRVELKEVLKAYGLSALRRYGRALQLTRPSGLKKGELIDQIVEVVCGDVQPRRTGKGAPAKDRQQENLLDYAVWQVQKKFGEEIRPMKIYEAEMPPIATRIRELEASETPAKEIEPPKPSADLSLKVPLGNLSDEQKRLLIELINSF